MQSVKNFSSNVFNSVSSSFNKESVKNFAKYVVTSTASSCLSSGLANALFSDSSLLANGLSLVTENAADAVIQLILECYVEYSDVINDYACKKVTWDVCKNVAPVALKIGSALVKKAPEAFKMGRCLVENYTNSVYQYAIEPGLRRWVGYKLTAGVLIPVAAAKPYAVAEGLAFGAAYLMDPAMKNVTANLLPEIAKKASSGFKQISQCASDLKKKLGKISWLSGGEINNQMHENSVAISEQQTELNVLVHQEKPAHTEEKTTRESSRQAAQEATKKIHKLYRESGRER
jgi:hypothetical protein